MEKYRSKSGAAIFRVHGGVVIYYPCGTIRWISNKRYDHLTLAQL